MADLAASDRPWEYSGAWVLAPMVRVNTLPFRLLCAEYGADMVYSEELVDKSVVACRRTVSASGDAEYRHADGKLIFSTVPHERVAFQLGTASGPDALAAANIVADDVRAIDVNMGCPVKFSTQGGMGSALLTQPERVRDILTTLVRNFGGRRAVTCKIRLLDDPAATLQLARLIEGCGVDALAVHCRRVSDRPRHWAQWDAMTELRAALPPSLPLLLNGDVFSVLDGVRALDQTRADGLMLARGALWNPALFARDEARLATQARRRRRRPCRALAEAQARRREAAALPPSAMAPRARESVFRPRVTHGRHTRRRRAWSRATSPSPSRAPTTWATPSTLRRRCSSPTAGLYYLLR